MADVAVGVDCATWGYRSIQLVFTVVGSLFKLFFFGFLVLFLFSREAAKNKVFATMPRVGKRYRILGASQNGLGALSEANRT